ncbi:hypothetical protein H4219_006026 [Mycoemilia scoparia]|uniref:Uncharacterized protein n=1 Tax=Mycoemilia scoparia TaxID=417184 RepID=A0A9W7ZK95_9FUNG|nr:hypothetical protein H4219_006026 [Mycoemilia scoparia]
MGHRDSSSKSNVEAMGEIVYIEQQPPDVLPIQQRHRLWIADGSNNGSSTITTATSTTAATVVVEEKGRAMSYNKTYE